MLVTSGGPRITFLLPLLLISHFTNLSLLFALHFCLSPFFCYHYTMVRSLYSLTIEPPMNDQRLKINLTV